MIDRHLSDEDLGVLDALGPDDPRRGHVEACAKCRSRWLDYQSFRVGEAPPAEAGADEAREALRATIRKEYATPAAMRPRRVVFRPPAAAWAGRILSAAAGLLIVAAAGWWIAGRPTSPLLRGPSSPAPLRLLPATWQGDSVLVLRWRGHPRADRYEVRLLGSDMVERARFDAGSDSVFRVPRRDLPGPAAELAWRVAAMRAGAELGQSTFGTIPGR